MSPNKIVFQCNGIKKRHVVLEWLFERGIHIFDPSLFRVLFVSMSTRLLIRVRAGWKDTSSQRGQCSAKFATGKRGGATNGLEKESRINLISRSRLSDEAASSSSSSATLMMEREVRYPFPRSARTYLKRSGVTTLRSRDITLSRSSVVVGHERLQGPDSIEKY